MKGKIENVAAIENVASGGSGNKAWILWSAKLTVDGNEYGYSDFIKADLEAKCAKLKIGSTVEFETEEKDGYENVKRKTEVTVLEEGTGAAGPAAPLPPAKKITDKEIEKVWKESADFVTGYWKEKKIVVEGVEHISPSINTVFMDKMKEKRKR